MKMNSRILLLLLFLTFKSWGQNKAAAQFSTKVLDALKTEDFEKVKELFPPKEIMDSVSKLTGRPLPDNFEQLHLEESKKEFERLFNLGKEHKID